jgi:hypothetical protein
VVAGDPVGVNVGKSRAADLADATADYEASLRAVWPVADFIVLNVSSPNTPGLRTLQQAGPLAELLALAASLKGELGPRPVLLKIAPDLGEHELDVVVDAAERHGIDGLVATNTTVRRDILPVDPNLPGGLSGAPLGTAGARRPAIAARADAPAADRGRRDGHRRRRDRAPGGRRHPAAGLHRLDLRGPDAAPALGRGRAPVADRRRACHPRRLPGARDAAR